MEDGASVSELSYTEASAELDGIIAELDQGHVDLDLLDQRFQRAVEIVEELDRRLRGARDRVDALMPRLAAVGGDGEGVEADGESGGGVAPR